MHAVSSSSLFLLAIACSARPADEPDAPESLRGTAVSIATDGPWQVRRAGATAAGETLHDGDASITYATRAAKEVKTSSGASKDGLAFAPASEAEVTDHVEDEFAAEAVTAGTGTRFSESRIADAAPLRAGAIDDNADLETFLGYLAEQRQRAHLAGAFADLDVSDGRTIRLVDSDGQPMPGVEFRIVDEGSDRIVASGTTYGDGCCPFYPRAAGIEPPPQGPFLVEVTGPDVSFRQHWDGAGPECTVTLREVARHEDETILDVVFVIDTTGSMGDEIDRIKQTLLTVTERLRSLELEFDLRYGAVLYRDIGDEYLTKAHPFTSDLAAFDRALQQIEAAGGGDGPESLNQGLAVAVDKMEWRAGAAHLAFLIADAPPHMDYEGDRPYDESLRKALARGIRVHTVAASGLDDAGSLVFRQIAQFTRGEFVFIEYGADVVASAAAHGVRGEVASNNLDEILFTRIRDEIARFGRTSIGPR